MDVADEVSWQAANLAEGLRWAGLFDVHVEEITKQFDAGLSKAPALQKLGGGTLVVEQIGLVAIEWLVEQWLAIAGGPGGEDGQSIGQPVKGIGSAGCCRHRRRLGTATAVAGGH